MVTKRQELFVDPRTYRRSQVRATLLTTTYFPGCLAHISLILTNTCEMVGIIPFRTEETKVQRCYAICGRPPRIDLNSADSAGGSCYKNAQRYARAQGAHQWGWQSLHQPPSGGPRPAFPESSSSVAVFFFLLYFLPSLLRRKRIRLFCFIITMYRLVFWSAAGGCLGSRLHPCLINWAWGLVRVFWEADPEARI